MFHSRRILRTVLGVASVVACGVAVSATFPHAADASALVSDTYHDDHRSSPMVLFAPAWDAPAGLIGEDMARAFLESRASLFELPGDLSNLRFDRAQESLLGTHYEFGQWMNGYPVESATVVVSVSKDSGEIYRVFNNSYPVKTALDAPVAVIAGDAAYDIAWNALRAHGDLLAPASQRTVYVPVGESFQLQTIVDLSLSAPYGGWETRIDATTGAVLSIEDTRIERMKTAEFDISVQERILSYSGPIGSRADAFARLAATEVGSYDPAQRASGTGLVFDPDPRTTLNNATIQDGSPASTFTPAYFTRNLLDITFNGSNYSLTGPWVTIANWDPPSTAPSTTTDGNWTATRGNNAFNDALVYFHIDQSQRYMQSLGFTGSTGIQELSIIADSDGVNGADNSYYVPSTNRLAFGHGCVDDSEDADVVLHEYGHAIQHSINSSWSGGDTGAMGEGFGDYWAGSYSYITDNGDIFHPEWVFSWDGHGSPVQCWNGRVMNQFGAQYDPNSTYGAHQTIPGGYQSDELWSTPLFQTLISVMDLGYTRESVDQIILESHFGLGSGIRMRDMANITIATAQALQPGNPHADVFIQKFLVHNIIDVPFVGLQVGGVSVSDAGPNGVADPGETVHMHVTLENAGTLGAVAVSGVISSSTPGVTISSDTSAFGDIPAGGNASNQTDFVVSIPANLECGDVVSFSIQVDFQEESLTTTNLDFELGTGVVLGVAQSIEPGLAIPDNNSGGVTSVMTVSGTGATVTSGFNVDINLTHTYIGDLIVRLTSPGGTTVTLHNRSGGSANDIIGNYPGTLTPAQPLSAFVGDPIDGDWTMFVSDNAGVDTGTLNSWGINDVQGYDCESAAGVDPIGRTLGFTLAQNEPNPLHDTTTIGFSLAHGDIPVELDIIDVSGRIVRSLARETLPAGEYNRVWDGRDDLGNPVGAGVYFYRLQQGDQVATRKLLTVR
ncbi:MAG: proprotein convertase P-domain-containing protein [Candidatus Eisenbacteria bacterium]|uniref:Proprotein convertase P-domain-containing protein n=1 Tax=Eiseniibacteriota bacterium TaxID=2212470 RepID=A0A956N8M6_UNCEI|nr:proprotein convertase P-domain-containing protein [Candidatus Eisenbacteria bacterium]